MFRNLRVLVFLEWVFSWKHILLGVLVTSAISHLLLNQDKLKRTQDYTLFAVSGFCFAVLLIRSVRNVYVRFLLHAAFIGAFYTRYAYQWSVGKTSTIIRYVEKNYRPDISSTVGASFFTCNVFIDDLIVKLQIWDTAGQERFKAMVPMFYRNANAALLVFDLTQEDTFESMKNWTQELKRNVEEPMILCVVGNKNDLCEKRQVDRETGLQYANSIGACYFECSAKEDQGVEQIFTSLSRSLAIMTGARKFNKISAGDSESGNSALMAESSELNPTDVGRTETASWSISSIAHGNAVAKPKCC